MQTTTDVPQPQQTSWPIRVYLLALVFAFVTLSLFTPALDGREMNIGRGRTQAGICLILTLRLLWAVRRKEQSKTWRVYVICMFLSVPIWMVVEPLAFAIKAALSR